MGTWQTPEEWVGLLERQKSLAQSANSRKGQKPATKASRAQLELMFPPGEGIIRPLRNGMTTISTTVVAPAYPPCTTPLSQLQPISISQLRLETHHRGKVLFVRAFGHPMRLQAVQSAVEDASGGVDRLAVYNFDSDIAPDRAIPKNVVFAVKEPYYKLTGDGLPTVRVDHPTDFVSVDTAHSLVPAKFKVQQTSAPIALDLKARGNDVFKNQDFATALRLYSDGIKACREEENDIRRDLFRNRAIANIHMKCYEQAVLDGKAAVIPGEEIQHLNSKAYYRAGCASYELREYESALSFFEHARKHDPDTEREYKRTLARIIESRSGKFDLTAITNKVSETNRRLDHASYLENVEVRGSAGRGRGLFAKAAIKGGDLVLLEKAYCAALKGEQGSSTSLTINLNTNSMSHGPHAALLVRLVQDAIRNPQRGRQLLDLYSRGYEPKSSFADGDLAVDVFETHQILEANVFGCPRLSTTQEIQSDDRDTTKDALKSDSCGIWLLASRVNHDCAPNATRAFIGDLMIVHAVRDIKAGEEITMVYQNNKGDHAAARQSMRNWQFECTCSICRAEEASKSDQAQRQKLIREVETFLAQHKKGMQNFSGVPAGVLKKAEDIHSRLQSTYNPELFRTLPRLALCRLGLWIAFVYLGKSKYAKAAQQAISVLRDYGYFVTIPADRIQIDRDTCHIEPNVVDAATCAAVAYHNMGQVRFQKELMEFAKESYRVLHGTLEGWEAVCGEVSS